MNVLWQTKTVLLIPLRTVENEQPVADWTEGLVLLLMHQILFFFYLNAQLNLLFPLKSSVKQNYITSHRPEHKTHSCVPNKSEIKTGKDRVMDQQMFSFRVVSVDLKTRPASAMWAKDHLHTIIQHCRKSLMPTPGRTALMAFGAGSSKGQISLTEYVTKSWKGPSHSKRLLQV